MTKKMETIKGKIEKITIEFCVRNKLSKKDSDLLCNKMYKLLTTEIDARLEGLKQPKAELGYYCTDEKLIAGYNNAVEHFNERIEKMKGEK